MIIKDEVFEQELNSIAAITGYEENDLEILIKDVIYEDFDEEYIKVKLDETGYSDLEKGYNENNLILYFPRIDKYAKFTYNRWSYDIQDISFVKEVRPTTIETVVYN